MQRNVKIGIVAGITACLIGIAGAAPTIYFKTTNRSTVVSAQPAFETPKKTGTPVSVATKPVISGRPVRVSVPSVRVDAPVVDGIFNAKTKQWSLGLSTAHWGVMTPQPNDSAGNTFIYGHYRPEVFAYLHNIKPGAEAYVTTENGLRFVYTFQEVVEVSPTDVSLFDYEGPSMLTLQTCSGSWFQNRQLFKFTFTRVDHL